MSQPRAVRRTRLAAVPVVQLRVVRMFVRSRRVTAPMAMRLARRVVRAMGVPVVLVVNVDMLVLAPLHEVQVKAHAHRGDGGGSAGAVTMEAAQRTIDRRRLFGAAVALLIAGRGQAAAQSCSINVAVDYHGWAGLDGWTAELTPQLTGWWRTINQALGAESCNADRTIRLEFYAIKPERIAAAARGDSVLINAPYVLANRDNPDMLRMIAHELVHVAQGYPKGTGPAWLTEGIADYVRYYVLFPTDAGRAFDPGHEDWREGYSPTAGLLAWSKRKWPDVVAKVNAAMRRGEAGDAALTAATGMTPDALWKAYLASHPDAASAAKRRAYWESLKHASPEATNAR